MKINRYIIIIIGVFFIFFFTLRHSFFIKKIFLPFEYLFSYLDKLVSDSLNPIFIRKNLLEENKRLSDELTKLVIENIRLKIIEEENEKLKKELELSKKENYKLIFAKIIGKKEEGGLSWFIIDQGNKSGIKKDFVVISEGVVVGKIIKTTENFSYLLPLLDRRIKIGALIISPREKINDKNKIEGIFKSHDGLIGEVDLVPVDKEIKNGDLVITSGREYMIPKGLLIGRIIEVRTKPTDIFHKVIVELPKKIEDVEIVSVIVPKIEFE